MTLTYGSLFSGIGGFDLGFDRAGMECAWQVEYDAKARSVLERHWPDVQRFEDVRNVGRSNLRPVDVICGGFPCQDVSLAGKRAGLAGERSGLWSEFSRIIGELAPAWVVVENVPGLLSSNGGADMSTVLWELAELGYGWAYRVLDAQYFGVAQRRRRVFIVGHLGTSGERAGAVLFEPDSLPWHPAPRRETGQGVATAVVKGAAIGRSPGAGPQRGEILTDEGDGAPVVYSVKTAQTGSNGWGVNEDVMNTLDGANGFAVAWHGAQITSPQNSGGVSSENSPTLNGDSRAMVSVRRLTPTECERLQGFPDGHTADQSDSARYKQLGNAVAVPVAEWIGRRIMEVI